MNKLKIKLHLKEVKLIPFYLLMLYFLFVMAAYIRQESAGRIKAPSTWLILFLWLAFSFLPLVQISKVRDLLKKRVVLFHYLLLFVSPIASFLVVETMVSNFNTDMFRAYSFYNLVWYILLYYLVFALLRSCRYTVAICNIAVYIASMVNYFVYLFRGNPILPSDLLAWKTGMSVASGYSVSFTLGFMISTLIMYAVVSLGYKLERIEKHPSVINRAVVIGTWLLFSVIVFHQFFDTDLIKSKIRVLDFFAPKYTYCDYGTVFGFVANVKAMETEEPEGYSIEQVQDSLDNASEEENGAATTQDKPNIIVIMNEAFSDLSLVGDFRTNMDYLPFIRSLQDNTTKGTMYVSVYGGATSDTEYEFLTGNSMAVMPQNCVPYQQFVTEERDSLATTLKDQGYYNVAIHPYEPSGYKRDLVYPLLGFDEFLSMDDFVNPALIRNFISDEESYKKIIEQYETKGADNPLFIFNVTMQNHGGYSSAQLFDDADTVRLLDYAGCSITEQYLSLLRKSDEAYQMLVEYFSQQKEHTIILLFGDHQPIAYSQLYDKLSEEGLTEEEELQMKYKVPFILWANYDITEDDISQISANYLSSYLLKTAGLEETAYNRYLTDLYEEVPVMNALFYIDKDNIMHSYSENTSYSAAITQYKYVGYNNALDKNNRLTKYYYLPNTGTE